MNFEIFLASIFIFWFLSFNKKFLFWVWLWQLKEYHLGRFRAHFQTSKGKSLIFSWLNFVKIILIFLPFFLPFIFPQPRILLLYLFAIFIVFSLEGSKALFDLKRKILKAPILTKKTALIILIGILFEILVLFIFVPSFFLKKYDWPLSPHYQICYFLLLIDFFSPFIATFFVAIVHPLAIIWRRQIIKKAKEKRRKFKDLIVIGITGSYGKTSTKEFLAEILSEKFKVLKTPGHRNSEVGISQCILNDLRPEHEIFVVEMGAYNRGGIKLLCEIAQPQIGILTGINEQHLATFGSLENIIKTKYELIESLPQDGLAIFNGSNPRTFQLYLKTKKPKKVYQAQTIKEGFEADLSSRNIVVSKDFVSFKVCPKNKEPVGFRVSVLGAHNVENILAASLVAMELGMTLEEIQKACQKIRLEQGGMRLLEGIVGLTIIDSTYSANPNGVMAALDYLKIWPVVLAKEIPPSIPETIITKKIIAMPCLIELGRRAKEVHQRIGDKIGQVCDLAIITTKDFFDEIAEAAISSGLDKENVLFTENAKEIFEIIKAFAGPGDVVLLEGRVPRKLIDLLLKK